MKIIIDDKIPYIRGVFDSVAEVEYLPAEKTTALEVKNADALITRTRTLCNRAILENSSVKFIATATIGYDHIDTEYCKEKSIEWTNAPGCNSGSVEQYIAAALVTVANINHWDLTKKCIGIVGVGNVGKKVAHLATILGMKVLLNDPPRQIAEQTGNFVDLQTIVKCCDIITLHVPLVTSGDFPTFHLIDNNLISSFTKKPLIINSCRGEVVDSNAIAVAIDNHLIHDFVADCWENEPRADINLINRATIATPHIAGYSRDGKALGTQMAVQAVSRFFGLGLNNWMPVVSEKPLNPVITIDATNKNDQDIIKEAITATYDIMNDDLQFRNAPHLFEKLRGDYPVRREFGAYSVQLINASESIKNKLIKLGFLLY